MKLKQEEEYVWKAGRMLAFQELVQGKVPKDISWAELQVAAGKKEADGKGQTGEG